MSMKFKIYNADAEMLRVAEEIAKQENMELEKRVGLIRDMLKDATPVLTGKASAGWTSRKLGKTFHVFNNVEYVPVLNNGHSKQAPTNFIEQVLTKFGMVAGQ